MKWLNKILGITPSFLEMEQRNEQIKIMMNVIDKQEGALEKLRAGTKHILGDDWFELDEVPITQSQQALLSDLLIIVLHNSCD